MEDARAAMYIYNKHKKVWEKSQKELFRLKNKLSRKKKKKVGLLWTSCAKKKSSEHSSPPFYAHKKECIKKSIIEVMVGECLTGLRYPRFFKFPRSGLTGSRSYVI